MTNDLRTEFAAQLSRSQWPYRLARAVFDGVTVAYTDEGAGPALVLVHDGMWSFVWREAIRRLRADFRVIAPDFPGAGFSPDSEGYSVAIETDSWILERLVDHLGLDRLTLVAHDLGGPVGLGLASRRPELIDGMVLANTFGWRPDQVAFRLMLWLMGSGATEAVNAATNILPRLTATSFGVGRHLDAAGQRAFVSAFSERDRRRRVHRLMRSVRRSDDYLERLSASLQAGLRDKPVLTVFGEHNDPSRVSKPMAQAFQARWKTLFPDVEQVVIANGYHFPMMDDPELFADVVRSWYRRRVK